MEQRSNESVRGEAAASVLASLHLQRRGAPLHQQIHQGLKRAIQDGRLPAGAPLPSETELASTWRVARGTVRRALAELAREGLLSRRQGRGTTVASPKIHQYLGYLTGFTEDMRARGLTPATELVAIEPITPGLPLQQLLGDGGDRAWKMVRRRLADAQPVAVETCYLRASLVDLLDLEKAGSGSLYALYRACGLEPDRAIQRIEAIVIDATFAELLDTRVGEPAFRHERITYDARDRVIEVVESVYRGDRYSFQVDLRIMG